MFIKKIRILNFRSIINEEFEPSNLNLFVGDNDIGKSNLLRALNLFFNGETSFNQKFNFNQDFSKYAKVPNKKAPEVRITITFETPSSYKENRDVIWTKKWRLNGLHSNEKLYSDGTQLEGRRKVGYWLDQIRFRYVPAIKGPTYFSELLRDLHDVLAQTISTELRSASSAFVDQIRTQTAQVSENILEKLGFESKLQIPENLSALFQILEFETTSGNSTISLDFRGDGIKVRHIPAILKFIAEQENVTKKKGSPKVNTIWGYEEPENNLELTKAFEKADELLEYSDNIQIFATTHSPAFYSLARKNTEIVKAFFVKRGDENNSTLEWVSSDNISDIDAEMGLLPLITPHIKEVLDEKKALLKEVRQLQGQIESLQSNTVFVEGPSDKSIIEKAFEILKPGVTPTFSVINSSKNGGGHSWVKDMLISWHYNREKRNNGLKCAGIFDFDNGTQSSINQVNSIGELKNAKVIKLKDVIPDHLISIIQKKVNFPFAIEEFFPTSIWEHAKKEGWLVPKSDLLHYNTFLDITMSFKDKYLENGVTADEELYFFKIKEDCKKKFTDYVCSSGIANKANYNGFQKLISTLERQLKN